LFEGVLAVGLVLVAVLVVFALWGCAVTCMPTKLCLCPFLLLLFIASIPFILAGLLFSLQGGNSEFIDDGCALANANRTYEMSFVIERMLFDQIKKIDVSIGGILNEKMCTEQCPCLKTSSAFATYTFIPEATLNTFGRTKLINPSYIPLTWIDLNQFAHESKTPLFFYSLPKKTGSPSKTCLISMYAGQPSNEKPWTHFDSDVHPDANYLLHAVSSTPTTCP
jgi:hypothetical protein